MERESKRLFIALGVIVLVIVALVVTSIFGKTKSKNTVLEVERLIKQESISAIYIMRDDCSYCKLNKSNMDLISEYGLNYYNVNTNELTSDDLNQIINMLGIDPNNFGTPDFYIVGNGVVMDKLSGLSIFPELFKLVKKYELIPSDSELYLNYVTDYDSYKKVIKSNENALIVLASSTCTYCQSEHPILSEIAKETGAKINYMYLDRAILSQEEYDKFMGSMTWFNDNSDFGTPTTLIVKNKEVVSELSGYRTKDEMISFLKDNEIIK